MVLSTTQSNSPVPFIDTNKENVILKPLRNANGRRQRSRPNNTPSPVLLAREAARDPARRHTQSPHITPTRSIRVPVQDMDIDMADMAIPTASNGSQPCIQLPRHLRRPSFRDISHTALEAVDPGLKGVPLEYIRQSLQLIGQQMLAVATTTTTVPPRDRLPRELEVMINDLSASPPTHLLAIYSKTAPRVAIHPAHGLVFAAHCAHLPPLPTSPKSESESESESESTNGTTATLPVVPLCLPHPGSFPILMHYLYTKRTDHLFASLLPTAPGSSIQCLSQLSQAFAATFTVQALLTHASRVHGLWSNVAALGVFDDKLSRSIQMVWEVLVESLAISVGAQWQSEKGQAQL